MRRALLIAVAALLAGILIGRLASDSGHAPSAPAHPDSPGPNRNVSGGVGVGYADTRAGAIAASAEYQRAFADTVVLHPAGLRSKVEAVATPDFAPAMLAATEPGSVRLGKGPIGEGLRAKVPSTYLGVPVAYRVLSFTPQRAVIRTWGFTVLGNASTVEPAAFFGLNRMQLLWSEGDWKIAASRGSFGPTPRLATPREGGEGFGVVDVLQEMSTYAVGP